MKINVWELVKDDKFFIGSYPDSFAIGRWFSAEELVSTSYEKIEKEYLNRFNPYNRLVLELGVFDVDNYSGLWQGEYDVLNLRYRLKHICDIKEFKLPRLNCGCFDEEFFERHFSTPYEAARATYFGKISSWSDDYIYLNSAGNLESANESTIKEITKQAVKELGLF